PEFLSAFDPGNGGAVIATYSLLPPGGDWEESDNGVYTISLRANEVADVDGSYSEAAVIGAFDVEILPTLGPDGFGYTGSQVPYQITDISATGALVLNGDDDASVLIQPSGFEFSVYGQDFTEVNVSSNGI